MANYPYDVRCKCGKKLAVKTGPHTTEIKFKALLVKIDEGRIAIKCPSCGQDNAPEGRRETVIITNRLDPS